MGRIGRSGPGNAYRRGITIEELGEMFATDRKAERWLIEARWPGGIYCPRCGSDRVQKRTTHPTMPHRCRACRRFFSVRTDTPLENSNLSYRKWAIAIYLMAAGIKGVSSMRLSRDLGIKQQSAWHLGHRIRECFHDLPELFDGPVEFDEAYIGGKERNKHADKKLHEDWIDGKTIVAGARDRATRQVNVQVVPSNTRYQIERFTRGKAEPEALVFTDDSAAYERLENHFTVTHSRGQYVDGPIYTNGLESFWALMKRGIMGIYHHWSRRHLPRYLNEFAGRNNIRELDTELRMIVMVQGMVGRALPYRKLAPARLPAPGGGSVEETMEEAKERYRRQSIVRGFRMSMEFIINQPWPPAALLRAAQGVLDHIRGAEERAE